MRSEYKGVPEHKSTPGVPKIDMTRSKTLVDDLLDFAGLEDMLDVTAADVMAYPDDPIDWIQTHFFIPELNGPLKLFPYHQLVMREAYRKDDRGDYVYDTIIWSDIKKV